MVWNFSFISPYSRMASWGRTFTELMPGTTSPTVVPGAGPPRRPGMRSLVLTSQTRTFFPWRAAARARAAERVDLPTPPFPVTTSRRLWKRSVATSNSIAEAQEGVNRRGGGTALDAPRSP